MAINGKALTAIGIGSIFVWSGIKGWSVLGTIQDLVVGHPPIKQVVNPLVTPSRDQLLSGGPDEDRSPLLRGENIGPIAAQYVGHAYSFGGAPGKDGAKPWDCSSFVNWIVSVKAGKAIPGYGAGSYDGSSHGPTTFLWGVWLAGLQRLTRDQVASGDIIVWSDHMGIAVDQNHMISALNHNEGTKITPIDGYGNGPLMIYGRLK